MHRTSIDLIYVSTLLLGSLVQSKAKNNDDTQLGNRNNMLWPLYLASPITLTFKIN